MKHLLLASLITLLAFGTACGQAPEPEPVASDGIQVHGHWTVTVNNPDGTVDAVHEFENALTWSGAELLTAILMGEIEVEDWFIRLQVQRDSYFYCTGSEGSRPPVVNLYHLIPASVYRDLEATGTPIKLSGSCTAYNIVQEKGKILSVGIMSNLDSELLFSTGSSSMNIIFTDHDSDPVIEVTENQALSFNISLSFPYDPNV